MNPQDLHSIQSKVFNLIKNGTTESMESLFNNTGGASTQQRLAIYQEGYRIRLRDALEDDFPSSLALWPEDVFEDYFERFATTIGSSTFTLNLVGQFWVEFIEKSLLASSQISKSLAKILIELSKFEWSLSEVYFKNCNPFAEPVLIPLDVESNLYAQLSPAIKLFYSTHPVNEIYQNKKICDPISTHLIIWSHLPSEDFSESSAVSFSNISEDEYLVWQSILVSHDLNETEKYLTELNWDESKQAQLIQSVFEFGAAKKILQPIT